MCGGGGGRGASSMGNVHSLHKAVILSVINVGILIVIISRDYLQTINRKAFKRRYYCKYCLEVETNLILSDIDIII